MPPTLSPPPSSTSTPLPQPTRLHNLQHYSIGRGEHLVLTHEPYKAFILPHWRFRTVALATTSATTIYNLFLRFYDETKDFVGMDMCRKFLQMGMTRAKRYANFKGGRKYDYVKKEEGVDEEEKNGNSTQGKVQREKGLAHEGKEEKERASEIFKGWWNKAREHEGYKELKEEWQKEKKIWDKEGGITTNVKKYEDVKEEKRLNVKVESDEEIEPSRKKRRVKHEKS